MDSRSTFQTIRTLDTTGRAWPPPRIARLLRARLGRELLAFGAVGVASTVAYGLLFLLLRPGAGPAVANAIALLATAVANTAANRHLTFGVRSGRSMLRDQVAGLIALGVALGLTTAAVTALADVVPHADRSLEVAVLVVANAVATIVRFALLRGWLATGRPALAPAPPSGTIEE